MIFISFISLLLKQILTDIVYYNKAFLFRQPTYPDTFLTYFLPNHSVKFIDAAPVILYNRLDKEADFHD